MKNIKEVFAPSNIAILKYWGKVNGQYPLNPSISFSLKRSLTKMKYSFTKRSDQEIQLTNFLFDGQENLEFKNKISHKIKNIFKNRQIPFGIDLDIYTENTFPHSSGIASSASSMAALSKVLSEIFAITTRDEQSSLAREFSGSASRSLINGWSLWGKTQSLEKSSQEYAIDITTTVHPMFHFLQDWIFVCSKSAKEVSSSEGHQRMQQHPFREVRLKNVQKRVLNFLELLEVAPSNDFFDLLEIEALELHGLMMTSNPPVLLFEANSIALMKKISKLRQDGVMCGYTLDAGSSVHLLFAKSQLLKMQQLFKENYFGIIGQDFVDTIMDECSLC